MTTITTHCKLPPPEYQRGLSLVELMISMVISLILLGGITALIVQQSQTRDELEKSSRQIENGRYAMQILHDDIQHAGFYGQYFILPTPPATWFTPGPLPDPCLTATASLLVAMPLALQGYDSPAASPLSCIPNANFLAGTDILVVRRANTVTTTMADAAAGAGGQVYLQTNTASSVLGVGTGASTATFPLAYDAANTLQAPLRDYMVHIYFVSPCSVPSDGTTTCTGATDDNGRPVPTLKRMDLSFNSGTPATTAFVVTPLVEGIENMQLDYGIDGDSTMLPASAPVDGYPDIYCSDPDSAVTCQTPNNLPARSATNPTNWVNVMAVRVNLLARNNDPTVGFSDSKTYNLGMATTVGPFSEDPEAQRSPVCVNTAGVAGTGTYPQRCNYKRHVFSELVRAVNPSGRRAMQ